MGQEIFVSIADHLALAFAPDSIPSRHGQRTAQFKAMRPHAWKVRRQFAPSTTLDVRTP